MTCIECGHCDADWAVEGEAYWYFCDLTGKEVTQERRAHARPSGCPLEDDIGGVL